MTLLQNTSLRLRTHAATFALCSCITMLTLTAHAGHTTSFHWTAPYSYGDCNQDGFVNSVDRDAIRAALTNGTPTNALMDIDADMSVTANDMYLSLASEYVRVPAATHVQGSTSNDALYTSPKCSIIATAVTPENEVYLDDYYISRFEVTVEDYVEALNAFVSEAGFSVQTHYTTDMMSGATNGFASVLYGSGEYVLSGATNSWDNKPLVYLESAGIVTNVGGTFSVATGVLPQRALGGVSYFGALLYCAHKNITLPTEYQWEKAALVCPTNTMKKVPYAIQLDAPLGQDSVPNVAVANVAHFYDDAIVPIGMFSDTAYPSGHLYSVSYEITTNLHGEYIYNAVEKRLEHEITTSNAHSFYGCYNMIGNVREITRDLLGPSDTNYMIDVPMFGSISYVSSIYMSNSIYGIVTNPWNNTISGTAAHGGEGYPICMRGASAISSFSLSSPFGTQLRGVGRASGVSRESDGVPAASTGIRTCIEETDNVDVTTRVFPETPRLAIVEGDEYYLFDVVIDNVNPDSGHIAALQISLEALQGIIPLVTPGTNTAFTPGATQFSTGLNTTHATFFSIARSPSAGVLKNTGTGTTVLATYMMMPPHTAGIENIEIDSENTYLFDDKGNSVEYTVVPEPYTNLIAAVVFSVIIRKRMRTLHSAKSV